MHVSRGQNNRLTGNLRAAQDADIREFSGTLELMRVLEELVRSSSATNETHLALRVDDNGPPFRPHQRTKGPTDQASLPGVAACALEPFLVGATLLYDQFMSSSLHRRRSPHDQTNPR